MTLGTVTALSALHHPLSGPVGLDFGLGDKVGVVAVDGEVDLKSYKAFLCPRGAREDGLPESGKRGTKMEMGKGQRGGGKDNIMSETCKSPNVQFLCWRGGI